LEKKKKQEETSNFNIATSLHRCPFAFLLVGNLRGYVAVSNLIGFSSRRSNNTWQ